MACSTGRSWALAGKKYIAMRGRHWQSQVLVSNRIQLANLFRNGELMRSGNFGREVTELVVGT